VKELSNLFDKLKDKLRHGDATTATVLAGTSRDMIQRMFLPREHKNWRNPNTKTGRKLMLALDCIYEQREAMRNSYRRKLEREVAA
jgi:hypothetical protein